MYEINSVWRDWHNMTRHVRNAGGTERHLLLQGAFCYLFQCSCQRKDRLLYWCVTCMSIERVTDHILKEHFEDSTSLLIDKPRDTLDATTTSETPNGRLGDTLDVVTKDLAMTLGSSLSQSFSSFSK